MNIHEQRYVDGLRRRVESLEAQLKEMRNASKVQRSRTVAMLWERRTARRIQDIVAEKFGVDAAEITSASKKHGVVMRRHIAMHLCCMAGLSRVDVAEAFRCHHSTVIYALERVSEMRAADDQMNDIISRLGDRVRDEMEAAA